MSPTKRTLISALVITLLAGGCRPPTRTAETGRLTIVSGPESGADIYLNDAKQARKTNAVFTLKPGIYEVRLVKPAAGTDEPLIGEATVRVTAGRSNRVAIDLSDMKIVPASAAKPLLAESPAQKAILEYYAALEAKDFPKAFAYFSGRGKAAQGQFWRFSRRAREIASVKVIDLKMESSDQTNSVEINRAAIEAMKVSKPREPAPEALRLEVLITTVDELAGSGLPKIESIVDSTITL